MPNWSDAYLGTINTDYNTAGTATWRLVIYGTSLSNTGQTYTRLTFKSATNEGLILNPVYIGARATAGDDYDFAVPPTQVTFNGGSAGFNIGTNAAATSDAISYAVPAGTAGVVVSFTAGIGTANGFLRGTTNIGTCYYILSSDAATQNAGVYAVLGVYNLSLFKIESGIDAAGGFMPILVVAD